MSKSERSPWTSWALAGATGVLVVTAIVLWLAGISYPKSGWYVLVIYGPCLFLWWLDGILRSTKEIEYQRHLLRGEVRREVRIQLDKRERWKNKKPLDHLHRVVDTEAEEAPPVVQVGTYLFKKERL